MRHKTLIVSTIAIVAMLAAPISAAGRGVPSDEAVGYWTAERVRDAQPRDIVLGQGIVKPQAKPQNPGKPDKGGGGGGGDSTTDVVTSARWVDSKNPLVDDLVGKVLFSLGAGDYVCSASTVAPSTGSSWVVMTAGHCTWDDGIGKATNWVFVPDFETVKVFGCERTGSGATSSASCFAAESLHPTAEWTALGDDYLHDVAFVRMADDRPDIGDLGAGVPAPAVIAQSAVDTDVIALGYPQARPYKGGDLIYCQGTATAGLSTYSQNPMLACKMTGGSSGGPWYTTNTDGALQATSLNSFGLTGLKGYMFGPAFDSTVLVALDAASR